MPEVDPDEIARAEGRGNAESGRAPAGEPPGKAETDNIELRAIDAYEAAKRS